MSGALSVHHGAFGRAALYNLDRPIITHAHREAHLVFHIDGDNAKVRICDECYELDEKVSLSVNPWQPHSFDIDGRDVSCMCLVLYIKPIWFLEHSESNGVPLRFGDTKVEISKEIFDWVTQLSSLLLADVSSPLFDKFLYEIVRLCFDESWRCEVPSPTSRVNYPTVLDSRIRRSLRLMNEQFSVETELDSLAKESGISRPHFYKLFKSQLGITPNIYLSTLRTEQAVEYLMGSNRSVTEIGSRLGFSSQPSFTRFFTSNVGIPPSDYRRVAHVV